MAQDAVKPGMPAERVTFSFDSAGWLYVYQPLICMDSTDTLGALSKQTL